MSSGLVSVYAELPSRIRGSLDPVRSLLDELPVDDWREPDKHSIPDCDVRFLGLQSDLLVASSDSFSEFLRSAKRKGFVVPDASSYHRVRAWYYARRRDLSVGVVV